MEAGIADYWFKYVGLNGAIVGMTTFGESAPAELLFEEFGFTVDNVVAKAKAAVIVIGPVPDPSSRDKRPVFSRRYSC
jgi:transketolase